MEASQEDREELCAVHTYMKPEERGSFKKLTSFIIKSGVHLTSLDGFFTHFQA